MTTLRLLPLAWGLTLALLVSLAPGAAAQGPSVRYLPTPPPWLPRYDLDVRLDVAAHTVQVRQRTTWTNRHDRPAGEIVFNAHAAYKVPDDQVGLLAKTLEILRMNADEGIYTDRRPLVVCAVRLDGQPLPFCWRGDTMTDLVVALPAPVAKGVSITLELEYTLRLPQKQGRWGQWQGVTQLSNWVPMVAVYDECGWHPTPFIPWHQPFYNEAGFFQARVTLPADQKVACSGSVIAERPLAGKDEGWKELTIRAEGVRDFALLCSARYREYLAEAQTLPGLPPVKLHVLAFPEHEHHAHEVLRIIREVFPYYSQWMGPYPWSDFTIAESFFGWNGNECATLVMIDERVLGMPKIGKGYIEYLIAHETCHQWWYNLIGTHGYGETWMDEAIAVYFAHRFLDQTRGPNSPLIAYPGGLEWLPNIPRDTYRNAGFRGVIGRGELGPTVQEMPKFGHVANLFGICYDKGGRIVGMIRERLGDAGFIDFMRRLYDRYAYRIIRVADFQRELEEYSGRSWDEFFRRWLYGAGLCDWAIDKVKIDRLDKECSWQWRPNFLSALHTGRGRCRVTVTVRQKAEYDEETVVGFALRGGHGPDGRPVFHVRIPLLPQAGCITYDEPPARVEAVGEHCWRVEVELPCEPVQIAVDPDEVLVDREPTNNFWKPRVRWRFTPVYTLLDESDLTTDHDRWNLIFGPWLYGAAYADPWYQRASVIGLRAGAYRTQQFSGGAYLAYRTTFRDIVAGADALWLHWPWPQAQLGFTAERRLATILDGDSNPHRGAAFARWVFQYNSSLYLPPIHYVEAFTTVQENFLPLVRHMVPGSVRYDGLGLAGLHYHLNYLTPYWDPKGGLALDVTYAGGLVDLEQRVAAHQLFGQFSMVKGLPDLTGLFDESSWPGKAVEPLLRYLGDTRVAVRLAGAGGTPDRAQYFALGGDVMLRGFSPAERQGSALWLASVEWRFPLWRHFRCDVVDSVATARNLSGALFYDVGDVFSGGESFGAVPHSVGAGLRLDVTWFGFVERTTLRFDVAKVVNLDAPVQFWFGANMPF